MVLEIAKYVSACLAVGVLIVILHHPYLADIVAGVIMRIVEFTTRPGRRAIATTIRSINSWRFRRRQVSLGRALHQSDTVRADVQSRLDAATHLVCDLQIAALTADETIASLSRIRSASEAVDNPAMMRRVEELIAEATGKKNAIRAARAELENLKAAESGLAALNACDHANAELTLACRQPTDAVDEQRSLILVERAVRSGRAIDLALAAALAAATA